MRATFQKPLAIGLLWDKKVRSQAWTYRAKFFTLRGLCVSHAELGQADALLAAKSTSDQHLSHLDQHRKRLWQPAATAVALLILAAALLTNRLALAPVATHPTAAENANPHTQSDSGSAPSIQKGSTLPRLVPPRMPSVSADARQHISDYNFAAEDYTTHFDLHGHPGMEIPQLMHRAQNQTLPKRVAVN